MLSKDWKWWGVFCWRIDVELYKNLYTKLCVQIWLFLFTVYFYYLAFGLFWVLSVQNNTGLDPKKPWGWEPCRETVRNDKKWWDSRQNRESWQVCILNIQGLWYFARSRSREFQANPRNPAKFTETREIPRNSLEILPNTHQHNIFESYLGCSGCLLAVNLLIYLETSSLQQVKQHPKTTRRS